jgi:hypothetical protein
MARIAIVTPVLDDWEAFQRLVATLSAVLADSGAAFELIAVDDGSNSAFPISHLALPPAGAIHAVTLVRLALNLGHQRAIAVGLTEASSRPDTDAVVVMDSDGEDRPEDVPSLLAEHGGNPDAVIFAQRSRRSESRLFKFGLWAYKKLFWLLARQSVDFGNFSLIPMAAVRRLCHMPDLWNNLPATVMRSRLPYRLVSTRRGPRYAGQSKMNFVALVIHGMSALSVYSDVIFVRLLVMAGMVSAVSLVAIVLAAIIRFATDLATPGWATTVAGVFLILLFQMVLGIVVASLALLGGRSRRPFVPKTDCAQFVAQRETIVAAAADRALVS